MIKLDTYIINEMNNTINNEEETICTLYNIN